VLQYCNSSHPPESVVARLSVGSLCLPHLVDVSIPLIAIGPGTGIAPIMGLLAERGVRRAIARKAGGSPPSSRDVVLFGSRHQATEDYFEQEFEVLFVRLHFNSLEPHSRRRDCTNFEGVFPRRTKQSVRAGSNRRKRKAFGQFDSSWSVRCSMRVLVHEFLLIEQVVGKDAKGGSREPPAGSRIFALLRRN
jgi:hypothetical protein